ncbi:MAG: LuxR C-terminal-related transcriptional regulator [Aggregatilineales bacterium]
MSTQILATKLYTPALRPGSVLRPRLIERLNGGLHGKLTLVSAPAGCGKTTLITEWISANEFQVAWLSLDEGDIDPVRFLNYIVATLQTIEPAIGAGILNLLEVPQPPPIDSLLTPLLNQLALMPEDFILVLDDYHVLDSHEIDTALAFLIDNQPPQMHLVITTREDPRLPLARLRARGQLSEIRAADLRFTADEAAEYLNQAMGLALAPEEIAALEQRTEGWITGLQLAAISMQGHKDTSGFIESFTGSHHFVLDYLVEEVFQHQSKHIQNFLLQTSILEYFCAELCDAIINQTNSHEIINYLVRSNMFLIPLDHERKWFRYHHLFRGLLRQRLQKHSSDFSKLHDRASLWYEQQGFELDAFHHAAKANTIPRVMRLIEGDGMPMHFRGQSRVVQAWLQAQPATVLDTYPQLWTTYASIVLGQGNIDMAEANLHRAELALQNVIEDVHTRDTIGRIAAIRATIFAAQKQVEALISHSHYALEYLHPDNIAFRISTAWKLGYAYELQGKRAEARRAYQEVIPIGQRSGNVVFTRLAKLGLGYLQEADNQLNQAAETYYDVLQMFGDTPLPDAGIAHIGLARIHYQWNELETAQDHIEQCIQLAKKSQKYDRLIDGLVFQARLHIARDSINDARDILTEANSVAHQQNMAHKVPEIADLQVHTFLRLGQLESAHYLMQTYDIPLSEARVLIAQGKPEAAFQLLEPLRQKMENKNWADECLKIMVLQSIAVDASDKTDDALTILADALALAQSGTFIRLFVDEGISIRRLVSALYEQGVMSDYVQKLLTVFDTPATPSMLSENQPLIEPLSERELEVLQLIAEGLSNREISESLFITLNTVKGHNRIIFQKLGVNRRTHAVAQAQALGLI